MENTRVVNWEKDGNVAVITLDNPPVNQYGFDAMDDTLACLNEAVRDADIKVIVFTAKGKVFCGGADLKIIDGYTRNYPGAARDIPENGKRVFNAFCDCPKPVIAAINGHALGGGLELAMGCDMRVAAPGIKLGATEIKFGGIPGGGGTQRLPKLVGYGRAMMMMLTGDTIDAEEALRIGLVNEVAPSKEELMDTAMELARRIASFSSDSLYHIKDCTRFGGMSGMEEGMERETAAFAQVYKGLGIREGTNAFLEKRQADFTNM